MQRSGWSSASVLALVLACSEHEPASDQGAESTSSGGAGGSSSIGGASSTGGAVGSGATNAAGGASNAGSGDSTPRCDAALTSANKQVVASALDALFVDKQLSAIDQYWAEPYHQHNPLAASGVAAFKTIMGSFVTAPSFSYQRLRTLADCDLVVVQGNYSGTGVIFDMFRVQNGKIMEHWDSDSGQASATGGVTEVSATPDTESNRAQVLELLQVTLIDGDTSRAAEFLAPGYVEHHEANASGPAAFVEYVDGESLAYTGVHHVIADGNFVFTLSEGSRGGVPYGFYDLFRLDVGLIVEHWDARRIVPATTQSGLPIF